MEQNIPTEAQIASPSFIQALFDQLHARQRELGFSDKTLMQITDIARTTFYRIWHDRSVDPHMDFFYIEKLCAALQIQLSAQVKGTPAAKVEVSEAAQAEVAANTADLLVKRKETIEEQLICFADKFYSKTKFLETARTLEQVVESMAKISPEAAEKVKEWAVMFM